MKGKAKLGADASIAAGPVGREAEAPTNAAMSAEMLSYSRAQGVLAGVSLSGSSLGPEWNNRVIGLSCNLKGKPQRQLPNARIYRSAADNTERR